MKSLSSRWAVALITDPIRASRATPLARRRAWALMKADRGQSCAFSLHTMPTPTQQGPQDAA
ncbi:hypothetical protein [Thioclava sp. GXIMD2076]|uniref:hypothetical protein n=1 Tax=Thioclava sp. GXIMD2076 TaxID=3131931 RepID=UPI0030CC1773